MSHNELIQYIIVNGIYHLNKSKMLYPITAGRLNVASATVPDLLQGMRPSPDGSSSSAHVSSSSSIIGGGGGGVGGVVNYQSHHHHHHQSTNLDALMAATSQRMLLQCINNKAAAFGKYDYVYHPLQLQEQRITWSSLFSIIN